MRKSRILKIIGTLCFIGVLGCLSIEPIKTEMIKGYHSKITRQSIKRNTKQRSSYNLNHVRPVTMSRIIRAREDSKQIKPVGQLLVPSGNVHLPISNGISNNNLMIGAGTMRANEKMGQGNYVLAGHHMINKQALFTPLYYHLFIGNHVYLTDMSNVYQYTINKRQIISPYDTGIINNTKRPMITLITCNDSGSKRLLLQGRLSRITGMHNTNHKVRRLLNQPTNNYNVLAGY